MTHETIPELTYRPRSLKKWLDLADAGKIALPNFQRSFLWKDTPEKAARYLKSILLGHPTGVYLTLEVDQTPQFKPRDFMGIDIPNFESLTEMVLDGQQRLTSLWQMLRSDSPPHYFIQIESFEETEITVQEVFHCSKNSAKARHLLEPAQAYKEHCIPVSVLNYLKTSPSDRKTLLWRWCRDATGGDPSDIEDLRTSITQYAQSNLDCAQLWYFQLPKTMGIVDIISIFIETNRSPATVRMFDIAVAMAEGEHGEDLRTRVKSFYNENQALFSYLPEDEQKWIPDLGEWLLKIGCLKVRLPSTVEIPKGVSDGLPPTKGNYVHVLTHAFKAPEAKGSSHFDELQKDLMHSIKIVESCGGYTWRTLPGLPEMYVIGALREPFEGIKKSAHLSLARRLLSSYLWRAFFSNRYHAQANTKLFEDYCELKLCLEEIADEGRLTNSNRPLIFNDDEYQLPGASEFMDTGVNRIPWIGSTKSRLPSAIVALSLRQEERPALDWVEGVRLDADTIRNLEREGKIDRHHIFPKRFLSNLFSRDEINSPLNGVILRKRSNLDLGSKDPRDYLAQVMEEANIDEEELRQRVESHLIPYAPLRSNGPPTTRYKTFRRERAKLLASELKKLATFPGVKS